MSNLTPGAPENARSGHAARRMRFRVLGALVLIVALGFLVAAGIDFFGATGSEPTRFWLFFVGLPLLFVAGVFLQLGFAGAGARYLAGELAPVLGAATRCGSCGRQNEPDARFCTGCGTSTSA